MLIRKVASSDEPNRPDGPPNAADERGAPFSEGGTWAFGLSGDEWLVMVSPPRPSPPLVGPITLSLIFTVICTSLLGLWAMHALVRPLRDLAAATREFDLLGAPPPLTESGPDEVRIVAQALGAMQERIRNLVEDRTRMLAAMGHDLRTPITRLRLRSEFLGDDALRGEFLRDLALMTEMIEGALTYLREGRHEEPLALVDLPAMLQTICDSWTDLGRAVDYDGPDHRVARIRVHALGRALANLVDNAVKYGGRVVVRLGADPAAGVRIDVEDDGPGIPETECEAMLRPFVRGDAPRNLDAASGFGLGLSIARAVIEGHGGTLSLLAAEPHGLIARIDLPAKPK